MGASAASTARRCALTAVLGLTCRRRPRRCCASSARCCRDVAYRTPAAPSAGTADTADASATSASSEDVAAQKPRRLSDGSTVEERLLELAADPSPQVRAEVVVAATYTRGRLRRNHLCRNANRTGSSTQLRHQRSTRHHQSGSGDSRHSRVRQEASHATLKPTLSPTPASMTC